MTVHQRILICDAAFSPHHWATWEDGIVLKYKDLIQHEQGNLTFFHGGTSRITGHRTRIEIGSIMFLKEVLRYDSRVPPLTNQNLFARDLNMCGYCNRRFRVEKLSRDHIIPVSKGGKNIWRNVITACKACNHMKADLPLGKAIDEDGDKMALKFKPYIPSHIERLIMQHRHIQTDQFDFLYTMLPDHSRLKTINESLNV